MTELLVWFFSRGMQIVILGGCFAVLVAAVRAIIREGL